MRRAGRTLATIQPPLARDADGREIAVGYTIERGRVIVEVKTPSRASYPVVVDPEIDWWSDVDVTYLGSSTQDRDGNWIDAGWPSQDLSSLGWFSTGHPDDVFEFPTSANEVASYEDAPTNGLYVEAPPRTWQPGDEGRWSWKLPPSTAYLTGAQFGPYWFVPGGDTGTPELVYGLWDSRAERWVGVSRMTQPQEWQWDSAEPGYDSLDWNDDGESGDQYAQDVQAAPVDSADTVVFGLRADDTQDTHDWSTAYLAGASFYLDDPEAPTVDGVSGSISDPAWVDTGTLQAHVALSDPGLGVASARLSAPSIANGENVQTAANPCLGAGILSCPSSWAADFSLDVGDLPDGVNTVTVGGDDAAGHPSEDWSGTVKVDHSPPSLSATGALPDADGSVVEADTDLDLHVDTTDGDPSSPQSGVTRLRLTINGTQVEDAEQECPDGSCSMARDWTVHASDLRSGPNAVKATAYDQLGHRANQSWTIKKMGGDPIASQRLDSSDVRPRLSVTSSTPTDADPGDVLSTPITVTHAGTGVDLYGSFDFFNTTPDEVDVRASWTSVEYRPTADSPWESLDSTSDAEEGYAWTTAPPAPAPALPTDPAACHEFECVAAIAGTVDEDWTAQPAHDDQSHEPNSCWREGTGTPAMYACNTDGRWQGWQKWDTSWYLANRSSLGEPIAFTHWFADESLNPCFTVGGWGYAPSGFCSEARSPMYASGYASGGTAGVTYGAGPGGFAGTSVGSGDTASWWLGAHVDLNADDLQAIDDADGRVRLVTHLELSGDGPGGSVSEVTVRSRIDGLVGRDTTHVRDMQVTAGRPSMQNWNDPFDWSGIDPVTYTSSDEAGLADLGPGDSITIEASLHSPALQARGETQTDEDYVADLRAGDGASLTREVDATGTNAEYVYFNDPHIDSSGDPADTPDDPCSGDACDRSADATSAGASTSDSITEHVPILTLEWSGPDDAAPGTSATYHYRITNDGSAVAHPHLSDETSLTDPEAVPGLPESLAPAAETSGDVERVVPDGGNLGDRTARLTWTDGAGDQYGPISATAFRAPANVAPAAVTGSAEEGQTLTADPGEWSGTAPVSYSYQWQRCNADGENCTDIPDATDATYEVSSREAGTRVRVMITADNTAGESSIFAEPTTMIAFSGDSACTDIWNGLDGGTWDTPGSWSAGHVPTADDRACIGDDTVSIGAGTHQTGSLNAEGHVSLSGGLLELTDAESPSSAASFDMSNEATLTGAGSLTITDHLGWSSGWMVGQGATVLASDATADLWSPVVLARTLRNDGAISAPLGMAIVSGGVLDNHGSYTLGDSGHGGNISGGDPGDAGRIANHGEFRKVGLPGVMASGVAVPFDNFADGHVDAHDGDMSFSGGTSSYADPLAPELVGPASGSWSADDGTAIEFNTGDFTLGAGARMTGDIRFYNGHVKAAGLDAASGHLTLYNSGNLELNGDSSAADLEIRDYGALTGTGTLTVDGALAWRGGSMTGSGSTVIADGATAEITGGVTLGRTLRNEGTVTYSWGPIWMPHTGVIDNRATFIANAETAQWSTAQNGFAGSSSDDVGRIENRGVFKKTVRVNEDDAPWHGTGVGVAFANLRGGRVIAEQGQLIFGGGTPPTDPLDPSLDEEESTGSWEANDGAWIQFAGGDFALGDNVPMSGTIRFYNGHVAAKSLDSQDASFEMINGGNFELTDAGATSTARGLTLRDQSNLIGAGKLILSDSLTWQGGAMAGTGTTVLGSEGHGEIVGGFLARTLRNKGTIVFPQAVWTIQAGGLLDNVGHFVANSETPLYSAYRNGIYASDSGGGVGVIRNRGTFEKTESVNSATGATWIGTPVNVPFANEGDVEAFVGELHISYLANLNGGMAEGLGDGNPGEPNAVKSCAGKPVDCSSGNQFENQTDNDVPGRGIGLELTRTYNSQAAVDANAPGAFGYGWTSSFSDRLELDTASHVATVHHANGSTVPFMIGPDDTFVAPARVQSTLTHESDGTYTYTLPDLTALSFAASGRLLAESDPNGNRTDVAYDSAGRIHTITDPSGRALSYEYNPDGTVAQVTDPAGESTSYAYQDGDLASVTRNGATDPRWQFGYDADHQLTSMTDGRGHTTTTAYDSQHRVVSQTDALDRTRTWAYAGDTTTITNPGGDVTVERFANGEPVEITRASGTPAESTQTIAYDDARAPISVTDGAGHETTFEYDDAGNRTAVADPNGHTTRWTYDERRNVTSVTSPSGKVTTMAYDGQGHPTSVSRVLHGSEGDETQTTAYAYDEHGQLISATDPLQRTTTYTYDDAGNATSETDPVGDKTTYAYDADSRPTASVSPRGNALGADPADFTTVIAYDDLGRPTDVGDPLGHHATTTYDGNDNVTRTTDGEGRATDYAFDAEDQLTSVTTPSGTRHTAYDDNGQVVSQADPNGHATEYHRDAAGRVTAVEDPLHRSTTTDYDAAGRATSTTDAAGRTTTFVYDDAGRLTGIDYEDPETPDVDFGYDPDGQRTSMDDGTGHSSYAYDSIGRLASSTDGHGATVAYGYDLADQQTSITYPNGHTVTRAYDDAGRVATVGDWLGNTTSFAYDRDSNLTATTFPSATSDVDRYGYDKAGQLASIAMQDDGSDVASIGYERNAAGQVTSDAATDLPGGDHALTYDAAGRLDQDGSDTFAYDAADNPTQLGSTTSMTYDDASQLTHAVTPAGGIDYASNDVGDRISATPTSGPATSYGYDQASRLVSLQRDGEPTIGYGYDGDGLRISKTKDAQTEHFSWDASTALPLLLAKDDVSYIYDSAGLPLEQIDADGHAVFFHHDQLGSTRQLTNATGEVVGSFSYDAFGNPTATTGTQTTPFGFAGEYAEADTGLVYLRARYYDPATGQFLTRDPVEAATGQPYSYAADDPINGTDPTGLICLSPSCVTKTVTNAAGAVASGASAAATDVAHGAAATGEYAWDHRAQIAEAGAVGACIVATDGACAIATGAAFGVATEVNLQNHGSPAHGEFWKHEAVTIAETIIGNAAGGARTITRLAGVAREIESAAIRRLVNAYLAAPGLGLVALEERIEEQLFGEREKC